MFETLGKFFENTIKSETLTEIIKEVIINYHETSIQDDPSKPVRFFFVNLTGVFSVCRSQYITVVTALQLQLFFQIINYSTFLFFIHSLNLLINPSQENLHA